MIVEFSKTFKKWFEKLKNLETKTIILKRIKRVEKGNFGDYKSVGDNVYELRIDYGSGYRIYFTYKNNELVILLCGGDKSTQSKDIFNAKKMIKNNEVSYDNK